MRFSIGSVRSGPQSGQRSGRWSGQRLGLGSVRSGQYLSLGWWAMQTNHVSWQVLKYNKLWFCKFWLHVFYIGFNSICLTNELSMKTMKMILLYSHRSSSLHLHFKSKNWHINAILASYFINIRSVHLSFLHKIPWGNNVKLDGRDQRVSKSSCS